MTVSEFTKEILVEMITDHIDKTTTRESVKKFVVFGICGPATYASISQTMITDEIFLYEDSKAFDDWAKPLPIDIGFHRFPVVVDAYFTEGELYLFNGGTVKGLPFVTL